jgi:hypothetical protein
MSNIIPHSPHSPKLADLTFLEIQDAWIVERNTDYTAISTVVEPEYERVAIHPAAKSQPDRLALSLAIGSFVVAGLGVAFIAGSFSKAAPPPTPSPAPTPQIIVIPPQKPADRCLAFCSGD